MALSTWLIGVNILSVHQHLPPVTIPRCDATHCVSVVSEVVQYNRNTLGIYAEDESGLTLGVYRNSQYKESFFIGRTFNIGRFGLTFAAATGYTQLPVVPLVVPSFKMGHSRFSFAICGAPSISLSVEF